MTALLTYKSSPSLDLHRWTHHRTYHRTITGSASTHHAGSQSHPCWSPRCHSHVTCLDYKQRVMEWLCYLPEDGSDFTVCFCPCVRLPVCPSVCLSGRLSVRVSAYPVVSLSTHLPNRPSVCPSVYPSVCLPIRSSVCLSIYLSGRLPLPLPIPLSICPFICLSGRLSAHLSAHLSVYSAGCLPVCLSGRLSAISLPCLSA